MAALKPAVLPLPLRECVDRRVSLHWYWRPADRFGNFFSGLWTALDFTTAGCANQRKRAEVVNTAAATRRKPENLPGAQV